MSYLPYNGWIYLHDNQVHHGKGRCDTKFGKERQSSDHTLVDVTLVGHVQNENTHGD